MSKPKLVKKLRMSQGEFSVYKKIINKKYHSTLASILFDKKTYGHNPKFTKQAVRNQLARLYKLKYGKIYRST